ncbi:MAG: IS21 family transposase [Gammaproteobacteria bacterium]|nr:IS21 family transposase [Gammaproteobacteria bacterium]
MAARRNTMRKIKDVLRLRLSGGLSIRQIRASTKISVGAIQKLLVRANELELTWPLPPELDEAALARLFYPAAHVENAGRFVVPDWPALHLDLKRPGMTKQLAWEEYTARFPNRCYSYSQFCARYRCWRQTLKRSMRQLHRAGEKLFVDYAGQTVPVVNRDTGEFWSAQVFVAVLGASNYTFAEATRSQALPDWLGSHVRAFEFFGGLPEVVIPDNLKSGVSTACRYDPDLNPSYQQLAEHYQVAIIPARPYKPKDKAKAEVGVQIVERWILARLRHQTFFSLAELNRAIAGLLVELNQRPFKALPGNRHRAFEDIDRPELKPLPAHPYRYTAIKTVKVNIDYHVDYQRHLYSVPHPHVGQKLELHATDTLVELYTRDRRVAVHPRSHSTGMTTDPAHMPERHRHQHQWTPERLEHWAGAIGEQTRAWVRGQLAGRAHPEQAYRVCLGLLNLSRDYAAPRLEATCAIANQEQLTRLKSIKRILKSNRDRLPVQPSLGIELPQDHENVRGPESFT